MAHRLSHRLLHDKKHSPGIYVKHRIPIRFRQLQSRLSFKKSGSLDKDLYFSHILPYLFNGRSNSVHLRNIQLIAAKNPFSFQLFLGSLQSLIRYVYYGHLSVRLQKIFHASHADPPGAACDQGRLSIKINNHMLCSFSVF